MPRSRGICKFCKEEIFYYGTAWTPWAHTSGSKYCLQSGYTRTPITAAEPVLETEVL